MRISILLSLIFLIHLCHCQSSSSIVPSESYSSSLYASSSSSSSPTQYANSSPSSSASSFSSSSQSSSGSTNSADSSTTASLDLGSVEKLVTYTTKQKTIFIACCGGTFVLLIALAILSGLSDTISRSRQKTKRTHA